MDQATINFLAGFITGGAIMAALWLLGWLDKPYAWLDRQLARLAQAITTRLIGEE